MEKARFFFKPPYNDDQKICQEFLEKFEDQSIDEHPLHSKFKYLVDLVKSFY